MMLLFLHKVTGPPKNVQLRVHFPPNYAPPLVSGTTKKLETLALSSDSVAMIRESWAMVDGRWPMVAIRDVVVKWLGEEVSGDTERLCPFVSQWP